MAFLSILGCVEEVQNCMVIKKKELEPQCFNTWWYQNQSPLFSTLYSQSPFISRVLLYLYFVRQLNRTSTLASILMGLLSVGCPLCPYLLLVKLEFLGYRWKKNSWDPHERMGFCGKLYRWCKIKWAPFQGPIPLSHTMEKVQSCL